MLLRQARGELDFYPRPPGGGRLSASARFSMPSPFLSTPSGWRATEIIGIRDQPIPFLSTPSGWRATSGRYSGRSRFRYFYPRPPGGGRLSVLQRLRVFRPYFYPRPPGGGRRQKRASDQCCDRFLSTPSGWRATAKTDKVFICFCAKGRRNCLFKTRKEKICRWRFKKDKFWVLIWCEGSGKSVCALASHCG